MLNLTPRKGLVSIMEHGLQLRQEISSIRQQFKGILDTPSSPHRGARTPGGPRTPLQTLDNKLRTPNNQQQPQSTPTSAFTPRMQRPRMGCVAARSSSAKPGEQAPPNALVALQNYLKNRTPTRTLSKRKLAAEAGKEQQDECAASQSKISRLSASGCSEKEVNKSDTPSTWSRKSSSLRRLSIGSRDSLKKLLISPSKRRNSRSVRTVNRSPILTNGILIRNKEGELLNPPTVGEVRKQGAASKVKKRLLVDPQEALPQSTCVLGPRSSGDGEEKVVPAVSNKTVELSIQDYTQSPDSFYVYDALKADKTADTDCALSPALRRTSNPIVNGYIQNAIKNIIPDRTYMSMVDRTMAKSLGTKYGAEKTIGDKTIGEISLISKDCELTMREQPSAMMNASGAGVLHSTLNYPLHSTMLLDAIQPISPNTTASNPHQLTADQSTCDSSSLSFCVDDVPFDTPKAPTSKSQPQPGNCDVCKHLRRQTGQGRLQRLRKPVALSESDFLFDQTLVDTSLNATRGSMANMSDLANMTCSHMENTILATPSSSMEQTTIRDITLRPLSRSSASRNHSTKSHSRSHRSSRRSSTISGRYQDSDSDKENSSATVNVNSSSRRHSSRKSSSSSSRRHYSSASRSTGETSQRDSSENLSSFSSSLNMTSEKKRELKKKLKKFNTSVQSRHERSADIKTLGFF